MRQWNVDPKLLCRQHLLGEHVEHHMFVGTINKGTDISGYIRRGLVNTDELHKRHAELAEEMDRRGYNHRSALSRIVGTFNHSTSGRRVDSDANLEELRKRCMECKERIDASK